MTRTRRSSLLRATVSIPVVLFLFVSGSNKPISAQNEQNISSSSLLEIAEKYRCAVAKLPIKHAKPSDEIQRIGIGAATAFFIDDHGDMLTAAHTFLEDPPLEPGQIETRVIIRSDGTFFLIPSIEQSDLDKAKDLDVLEIHTGVPSPCFIPLGSSRSIVKGAQLSTLGYPGSRLDQDSVMIGDHMRQRAYAQVGPLLDRFTEPEGRELMKVQMFGDLGESGSPVIDQEGYAVGVLVMKEKGGNSFIWSVPSESLQSWRTDMSYRLPSPNNPRCT